MGLVKLLRSFYDKHYRKLLVVSFLILLASLGVLAAGYARTGEWVEKGVSLKGGITLTVPVSADVNALEQALAERFPEGDIAVRELTERGVVSSIVIEAADVEEAALKEALPELGVPLVEGEYSIESMGGALGERFFSQTIKALVFAFIMMALVVYITFRSIVPSSFVVLAAVSDIISTLAVVNLLGVKLSTAGLAAFLMLIGYSVDTDIMMTTKVLKRKGEGGTVFERTVGAMRTGVLMTGTALVASIIGLILAKSGTIHQIMLVVTIGLSFDLMYTWFQNAGILRWYLERKDG